MARNTQTPQWWPPSREFLMGIRDIALFLGGLIGLYHETFVIPSSDPELLVLFATMIGLPAFIRKD